MSDYAPRINWDSYYDPPEYPDPPETCQIKGCGADLFDEIGEEMEDVDYDYGICAEHNIALRHFPWLSLCGECGRIHARKVRVAGLPRLQVSTCYQCENVWIDMARSEDYDEFA